MATAKELQDTKSAGLRELLHDAQQLRDKLNAVHALVADDGDVSLDLTDAHFHIREAIPFIEAAAIDSDAAATA